jgi:hypothetical protein
VRTQLIAFVPVTTAGACQNHEPEGYGSQEGITSDEARERGLGRCVLAITTGGLNLLLIAVVRYSAVGLNLVI